LLAKAQSVVCKAVDIAATTLEPPPALPMGLLTVGRTRRSHFPSLICPQHILTLTIKALRPEFIAEKTREPPQLAKDTQVRDPHSTIL
jgi:hypothetical protein